MQGANSLEKTLMLGKIEGKRRKGWQRMTWLHSIPESMEFEQTPGESGGQRSLVQSMGSQRVRHILATGQQQAARPGFE